MPERLPPEHELVEAVAARHLPVPLQQLEDARPVAAAAAAVDTEVVAIA